MHTSHLRFLQPRAPHDSYSAPIAPARQAMLWPREGPLKVKEKEREAMLKRGGHFSMKERDNKRERGRSLARGGLFPFQKGGGWFFLFLF